MSQIRPEVSVVIPTRNRGESVIPTLESVLNNIHANFEILLIDQSTNDLTKKAIGPFRKDLRFRYISSSTTGAGRARNVGLNHARGSIIVYTDDDCTVPPNWLELITRPLMEHPQVGAVFCSVAAGPHDSASGVITNHIYSRNRKVCSISRYLNGIGMAAGMAIRRNVALDIGGFDANLGPGSVFRSGEDHDIALRTLRSNWCVWEAADVTVVHHGFRTYEAFRGLTARDWFAIGAVEAKILKCGHLQILTLIAYNLVVRALLLPFSNVLQLKRPQGFKRLLYFIQGFRAGIMAPVARQRALFVTKQQGSSEYKDITAGKRLSESGDWK